MTLAERITFDPEQCGGKPCIRHMRIRVLDILELLASDMSHAEILKQLPDLEEDDIRASLRYAARYIDHPRLVASHRRNWLVPAPNAVNVTNGQAMMPDRFACSRDACVAVFRRKTKKRRRRRGYEIRFADRPI